MKNYTLNKYDFKKFLLDELPDTRQEDLIFWKKTIPLPVDLIYNIFDFRGELLAKYVDQVAAAYVYASARKSDGADWQMEIQAQPTKENTKRQAELLDLFGTELEKPEIQKPLCKIADLLMLNGYIPDKHRLMTAISHEGRKYKRLYMPRQIRDILTNDFPELLNSICISNWDMFSNVVADELKIYRMGFADAFSGIFNKLIDFIITNTGKSKLSYTNVTGVKITQAAESDEQYTIQGIVGQISDGSIWEPRYINARSSYILNRHHPFNDLVRSKGEGAQEVVSELISSLSEIENETVRDADKRIIENLRQDISRKLRIRIERLK